MAGLLVLCWLFCAVDYLCFARHISVDDSLSKSSAGNLAEAAAYLTKFGYLNPTGSEGEGKSQSLISLSSSIAAFQEFAGLNVTGELDNSTLSKMNEPRCGVKDILGPSYRSRRRRRRRYVLQGSRWRVRNLRYKILSWPTYANDKDKVREIIRLSFDVWAKHSALTFEEVSPSQRAQIEIRFESGEHGDGDPFDGTGGTLAHAFFPLYGGDAHFDDDERWVLRMAATSGTNLFMTASHEFGHSLGLSHSNSYKSLMGPFYQRPPLDGSTDVMTEDDILGIQALYGPPKVDPAVTTPPVPSESPAIPSEDSDNILCNDPEVSVDAMFMAGSQSQTYVFKGSYYWKLTSSSIADGYPRRIKEFWDQVPDNVDAVFSWMPKERIYFFKGNQYWRMTKFVMDSGYPKLIRDGFRGIPDNIDAALRWTGNGKLYFFKGTQYWKYDSSRDVPVSDRYPQPITNWRGIPGGLDAALTYSNGHSYFFKKGYYFRFNDASFKVDDAAPPYPRPIGPWWFGCKSQRLSATSSGDPHSPGPTSFHGDAAMGFGDLRMDTRNDANRFSVNLAFTYLSAIIITMLYIL